MSLETIAQYLSETPLAYQLADSGWLFGTVESVHVLALTLVVGTIALVDLRLLGFGPTQGSIQQVVRRLVPVTLSAFVVAALSGSILIFANPTGYANNKWFAAKFVLLALAGVNALAFHFTGARWLGRSDAWAPRVSGALSLLLWIGVVTSGRWIGYTI